MKALKLTGDKMIALTEVEIPKLLENEVLVKIHAAALNRRDAWISEGKYAAIRPAILGSDGCGTVVESASAKNEHWIGKKVVINPNIQWGDNPLHQSAEYHILGMPSAGTFAEYIAVPADRLHEKPAFLSDEAAAALPLAGLTAYRAVFTHGEVGKNTLTFISGAGGGVQQFAFQFALAAGADVYASTGDDSKADVLKKAGAKAIYNYKNPDWSKASLKDAGKTFETAIDSSGGETFASLIKMLGRSGKLVFYGATNGLPPAIDLHRIFFNQICIQGSTMGNDAEFAAMLQFVTDKKITPFISSVRPLEEIESAFEEMKNGKHFGKLVIKI
jgi:NADPH:quinone reductase-like Zn-dependent oxidoreductase